MIPRETFLDMAVASVAAKGRPTPEKVEAEIDAMLSLAPHLRTERQWLIDTALTRVVVEVGKSETLVDKTEVDRWIKEGTKKDWLHWPWLELYLDSEVRRPIKVMKELDDSTTDVIDMLGDPKTPGISDRRGLVVGHVQSGKTQHYTALAAKALDAGYKIIIILSGIHENLRQQTQERIERELIGKDSRGNFGHIGVREWSNRRFNRIRNPGDPTAPLPDLTQMTTVAGDFGAAANRNLMVVPGGIPVILVVKKNASILANLHIWMTRINDQKPHDIPTLVIDDEADHSSINTAPTDRETNPTTINRLIRQILWCCNRARFVGYTATPYANIFMDPMPVAKLAGRPVGADNDRTITEVGADIFPKSFITSLKSPGNYIGPEEVFGRGGDESLGIPAAAPLPMHRLAGDGDPWLPARHKKDHPVSPDLPESLRQALRAFLVSSAARMSLGDLQGHMSMLVHVSRFKDVQEQVTRHVENELSSLAERLLHGANASEDWHVLEQIWNDDFAKQFPAFQRHPSQQLVKPQLPDWKDVKAQILPAFQRMKFASINSNTNENLDYSRTEGGLVVVAVGGDRLSRGLTLSGLSVSYFLRGARAFDTLMQMGRWFGYRPGYAHLCRVYAPRTVVDNFRTIALATEELRREFSRMCYLDKRPTDYGLKIREPRVDLLVTAMNKMRRGETVRVHFSESLVSSLDIPHAVAARNYKAFVELVRYMEKNNVASKAGTEMAGGQKGSHHVRWHGVSTEAVLTFLREYRATSNVCFDTSNGGHPLIARFVESMYDENELTEWTVALIGNSRMKRKAIEGSAYPVLGRKIDTEKEKTRKNQYVFQGVAVGQDEAIDLEEGAYARARAAADALQDRRSVSMFYRANRSVERGLLLLYPIVPERDGNEVEVPEPVVGVAVSFPSSARDPGIDYVCNPRMLEELFGVQFAEDIARDDKEDADSAAAVPKVETA